MRFIKYFKESIEPTIEFTKAYGVSKYKKTNKLIDDMFMGNFVVVNQAADDIAKEIGYSVIKKLGEGAFGIAYLLNDNKVLKLTTNKKEVTYAYKSKSRLTKYIINYYNTYTINLNGKIFYALLMDYVCPITDYEKKLYEKIYTKFYNYDELTNNTFDPYEMYEQIEDFLLDIECSDTDKKELRNIFNKIKNIAKDIQKSKIADSLEMHPDNIGKDEDGNWVYYDVVASSMVNDSDISGMKTIYIEKKYA